SEHDVRETFQAIADHYGGIDVLVNNAGLLRDGLLLKEQNFDVTPLDFEQFKAVMDVNVNGAFLCGREAAAHMYRGCREGVIINMSSVSRAGNFGQTSYSASKAAMAAMTVTWAKELGRYGIRVAAIAPGVVHTPMTASMKPEALDRITASVPIGRIAKPEQIADAVTFILENSYFNGRVLEIDGGLRL
uniref:SDR family oxidoreductase n=1 Tax=Thaumasiovibrio occultus TaxID=1891184 RepID=UPI000D3B7FE5